MRDCIFIALAAVLLVVSPASAQDHMDSPLLTAGLVASVAASGADLAATMDALGRGVGHEANPFFAPFAAHPVAAGAWKMGAAAAIALALQRAHRTHPRLVTVMAWTLTAVSTGIAVHNARLSPR